MALPSTIQMPDLPNLSTAQRDELLTMLAELAHNEQWSTWLKYMFAFGQSNSNGTLLLPKAQVDRWSRQANTPFRDLPDGEERSDYIEAAMILEAILRDYDIVPKQS